MDVLFSIITITLNDPEGLQRTVDSVLLQDFDAWELIIVDGGSGPGTQRFLISISDPRVSKVSERDNGVYDAMNKGLTRATGHRLLFLNSGDVLADAHVLSGISRSYGIVDLRVIFGRAAIKLSCGRVVTYPPPFIGHVNIARWLSKALPNHQAMFFPMEFCRDERYRTDLRISSDSDYKIRAISRNGYVFDDRVIARFALGGVSSSLSARSILRQCYDRMLRHDEFGGVWGVAKCLSKGMLKILASTILGRRADVIVYYAGYVYTKCLSVLWWRA